MQYLAGGGGGSGGTGALYCGFNSELELVACTIAGNRGGPAGVGGSGVTVPDRSGRTGRGLGGAGGVGGVSYANTNITLSASVINTVIASNFGAVGGLRWFIGHSGRA